MNKPHKSYVLPLLTIAFLLFGVLIFVRSPSILIASQIGGFLAGITATLAFFWLIAGFFQQRSELQLQREELKLQRISLDLQKEELKKIGKYNALHQIGGMLREFNASLVSKNLHEVITVDDLPKLYTYGWTTYWKVILDGRDPKSVYDAYMNWSKIEGVCTQFLSIMILGINLYAEATGEFAIVPDEKAAVFIYTHNERLRRIPHLQQFMTPAYVIATDMYIMEPGIKRVRLAGFEAVSSIMPNVVKQEELAKLRDEIAALDEKQRGEKNS